jgi:IS30 family transposase/catechol 2,3-dioxygenase-like lactoylglutathione lyase family enzyme
VGAAAQPAKLVLQPRLRAVVEDKLALCWSPQQIAGWRLPLAFPEDPEMRVSHETIYLSLFVQSRRALRRELQRCLQTGRTMRYPRGKRLPQGRGQLRDVVLISERPAEAEDRAVPGHWEGDLLLGKRPSAVVTLVERTSRYVTLVALPDGYKAEQVRPALAAAVAWFVVVYFCDPRSPWQRGSNENTNGLLRQYLAKGADLRQFNQAALDAIAAELNGRPRQTLGFQTPSQVLTEALHRSPETATVSATPRLVVMSTQPEADSRWPEHLPVGAVRIGRVSAHYDQTVQFYRDMVGLPVLESFEGSYGEDGTIFGLPDISMQLEIVRSTEPAITVDRIDTLVFYLPDAAARERLVARMAAAGLELAPQHPYWQANGGMTYRDPDGREVVFVSWVYGVDRT